MKKLTYLSLLLLALLLAACGSPEEAPAENPAPTTAPADNEGAEGEAVVEPTDPDPTPTLVTLDPTPTLPPPVVSTDEASEEGGADSGDQAQAESPASPFPQPPTAWPNDVFGYGVQSHAIIGDPAYSMDVISGQLGVQWVKVQVRWADIEREPGNLDLGIWDSVINEASNRGLYLMLSVVTSPEWSRAAGDQHGPPDDPTLYYGFISTLLNRYPGKVHAMEIWNEQNLDREWQTANGVAPIDYVSFLQGAYDTIKGIDPSVIVISGALAPTGANDPEKIKFMDDFIWTDEAIGLGLLDYTDCVGVHHNGYNLPPNIGFDEVDQVGTADDYSFKGPWTNPHHSWSFKTTLEVMADKVQAVKPDIKLCVTEFGWGTSEGYDAHPEGFGFFLDNTQEEQAQFIVQAYEQMRTSGDVRLAFLFNFDFGNKGGGPTDDSVPYSIVDTNGVPRAAFGAISAIEKQP